MPLTRLLYFSTSKLTETSKEQRLTQLVDILAVANKCNKDNGITGVLAFDNVNFIQVLEGDREKVWRTFLNIMKDQRHTDITLAEFREVSKRQFAEWSMGLAVQPQGARPMLDDYRDQKGCLNFESLNAATLLDLVAKLATASYETLGSRP